jgi:hypothetical protein
MKTQVITIEAHDDIISIRDKMKWSKTSRILLILPAREKVLKDRLDVLLVLRQSLSLGAQLALVTRDADVRYYAKILGIPVFESARQAQEARWSRPRLTKLSHRPLTKPKEVPNKVPARTESTTRLPQPARLAFFALGILAVLSIAATVMPSAELTLTPRNQTQEMVIAFQASPTVHQVRIAGMVPLRKVTVVVEGQDSLTPSGTVSVPRENAKGRLLFTNLTDRTVIVPAGTIVSTPDLLVRFATGVTDYVPAGPGQTALISATALTPGSRGNLPADQLRVIEGALGASLTVTNPQPTEGGSDVPVPAPTPLDRTRLSHKLLQSLQQTAVEEIQAQLPAEDSLLTPKPDLVQILEKTFEPADDQPTNELILTLRAEYEAQYVAMDDLRQLANAILDANLPQGYLPLPQTLHIEYLGDLKVGEDGIYRGNMRFSRTIQAEIPRSQVVHWVLGLTPEQAKALLAEQLPLLEPARIVLKPSWLPRLPFLPMRIHVNTP